MKRILAVLLPLTLMLSAVSCSKNSSSSDISTSESVESTENMTIANPAASGTGYTKGGVQNNMYTNDHANIKMTIPEALHFSTEAELNGLVNSSLSYYTDNRNKAFEEGTIWDGWVTNDGNTENIFFRYINTKKAFPNISEPTPDDVLDVLKDRNAGSGAKYEDRVQVTMGGQEYTREVYKFEATQFDLPYSNYLYSRRIDDDLICLISVSTIKAESTPEFIEGLFN